MSRTTQTAAFIDEAYEGIQAAQAEAIPQRINPLAGTAPDAPQRKPGAGRPTSYTRELATKIIEEIRLGRTPNELGETEEWCPHPGQIYRWMDASPEFREAITRARAQGAAVMADRALRIADNADDTTKGGVQKARLQVDARFRLAAVYDRRFSDRQIITHENDASQATALPTESLALIAQELARLLQDRKAIDVESVALDAEPDQHRIDTKP